MKKLIAPFALLAALTLTGCTGVGDASTTGDEKSETVEKAPAAEKTPVVPDLTGAWAQTNRNSEESYQQATIAADTITVEWVADGGDTTSIYWVGSFAGPTDAETYMFTSVRDAAATDSAIMASTDDTKEFTYEGDTLSYKVSALGTSTIVKLQKK